MDNLMHILQFTPSTLARRRGEEAGQKVVAYVNADAITLDFSESSPSVSCIEGLVLALHKSDRLRDVTLVSDDAMQKRLARISGKHVVAIYVHNAGEPEEELRLHATLVHRPQNISGLSFSLPSAVQPRITDSSPATSTHITCAPRLAVQIPPRNQEAAVSDPGYTPRFLQRVLPESDSASDSFPNTPIDRKVNGSEMVG